MRYFLKGVYYAFWNVGKERTIFVKQIVSPRGTCGMSTRFDLNPWAEPQKITVSTIIDVNWNCSHSKDNGLSLDISCLVSKHRWKQSTYASRENLRGMWMERAGGISWVSCKFVDSSEPGVYHSYSGIGCIETLAWNKTWKDADYRILHSDWLKVKWRLMAIVTCSWSDPLNGGNIMTVYNSTKDDALDKPILCGKKMFDVGLFEGQDIIIDGFSD